MPNQCKSEYPDLYDQGREDRSCGGPAQEDAKLGYTAGLANGHSRSTGERNDPLKAANESVSRGVDVTVPALQMKIHDGWAQTKTGINPEGVPESRATVDIDSVAILTGLIQLKGIHSEGIAISDGTEAGSKFTSTFSLREAFVAGVPVVIGRDGVSVRSDALLPGKNVQDAAKEVSESLKAADVQLRLIPAPATSKQAGHASSQAQGVEIVHQGATLTPSNSSYRFGFVSASAGATRSTGESGSSDAATAGDPSGPAGSTGTGSASGPASTDSQPGTVPTWSGTSDSTSNPAMGGTSTSIATPDDGPASAVSGWSSDPDVSPTATSASASAGTTLSSVPGVPPGPAQGAGTEALGTLQVQPGPVLGAVRASHEVLPAKKVKNMVGVMLLLGVLGALSAPLRKLLVTR